MTTTDKLSRITRALALIVTIITPPVVAEAQDRKRIEITKGKIVKIDESGRRVKITHGELKQFNMQPMTMYFGVTGATDLTVFREDDEIQFALKRGRDKTLRIMAMCTLEENQTACLN